VGATSQVVFGDISPITPSQYVEKFPSNDSFSKSPNPGPPVPAQVSKPPQAPVATSVVQAQPPTPINAPQQKVREIIKMVENKSDVHFREKNAQLEQQIQMNA
jgi:hypothetical protein